MLCFVMLLLLVACDGPSKEKSSDAITTSNKKEFINTSTLKNRTVVSYNFEGLEPLLTKSNDSTYVINFWATWCKPCIKEMPYFEKLNTAYATDKVKVIFVSLDFPDKLEKQVIPFIEKNNIQSEVVLLDDSDANRWIPLVSNDWSGAIPATIIYNKNTRRFFERSFTFEELEKEVQSIL